MRKNLLQKILLCLLLLFVITRASFPVGIYADEQATDSATPTANINVTPTDTPTPTVTIDATNSADVTNTVTDTSNSGVNTIQGTDSTDSATLDATPSATPTPEDQPTQTTTTGDAVNTTTVDNAVNTTNTNSQIVYQTINIFLDQNGNIDLSTPITIAQTVASESADPTQDVIVASNNNYATVNNAIVGTANTGDNTSSGNNNLVINTGNAYSIVSLINKVNLTVVDSTIHIITVNIYGNLTGNILLPQLNSQPTCKSCSIAVTVNNSASVTNNVTTTADTGDNTIASGSGTIDTGNATSMTNITNILNTFLFQTSFEHIYVNTFGTWDGNFLGWDTNPGQAGGQSLDIASANTASGGGSCTNCANMVDSTNTAHVNNIVSNTANTGGNTTSGGTGNITTGNAYAFTNIINLINSVFVRTTGFLGFVNIFGSLHGNIGGANYFVTPTPMPTSTPDNQTLQTDSTSHKEDGGALSVETSNNVGAYVLPGDTVTFFANVKNIGTGKVYDTHLHLGLIQNGQEVGGADFTLGDITAGHGAKISTGLVLSHAINPGNYIAQVTVTGTTGDANTSVSATAESTFLVSGIGYPSQDNQVQTTQNTVPAGHTHGILGTSTVKTTEDNSALYLTLFGILLAYIVVRILRSGKMALVLFVPGYSWKERLHTLRMFLL